MARTRALILRDMRLCQLSHGGHDENPGMVLPTICIFMEGTFFYCMGRLVMGCLVMGCLVMGRLVMGRFVCE